MLSQGRRWLGWAWGVAGVWAMAGCGAGDCCGPVPEKTTEIRLLKDGALPRLALVLDGVERPAGLLGQRMPLYVGGGGDTQIARIDTGSCTVTERWEDMEDYLDAARESGLNLVHVELWNVWEPSSAYPFLRDGQGRFRVQAAVERGEWNEEYFGRVRQLLELASARGIVVLFSLFNHYNVRISDAAYGGRPWAAEPLRAANTDTNFGLADSGADWKKRTAEFLAFEDAAGRPTDVGRIQRALVERLVQEFQRSNVILEPLMAPWIYGNPYVGGVELDRWNDWLIGVIRAKERELGRGLRASIEVTPGALQGLEPYVGGQVNQGWDLVAWRAAAAAGTAGLKNWGEVDFVAYTGGFAFGQPPFGEGADVYLRARLAAHLRQFPEKLPLFNTDGFNHRYAPLRCNAQLGEYVQDVRHGWWDGVEVNGDLSLYPMSWARSVRQLSDAPQGYAHMLNWSMAKTSMEDLARSRN